MENLFEFKSRLNNTVVSQGMAEVLKNMIEHTISMEDFYKFH